MEKYCINCKWCKKEFTDKPIYYECVSPKNSDGVDLITGKNRVIFIFCETHRTSEYNGCTKKGLFYEDK